MNWVEDNQETQKHCKTKRSEREVYEINEK